MNESNSTDPKDLRKIAIGDRKSKVEIGAFASVPADFAWYDHLKIMLPRILRGKDLEDLASAVAVARHRGRPVVVMMGAHVVKCGLGGLVGELLRSGIVTAVAMNGACAIHDVEIAMWGKTSEDVDDGLKRGDFGMAEETAAFFNEAAGRCLAENIGLGSSVARSLLEAGPPNHPVSVIATAAAAGVEPTIHVAIGTDIVHQHDEADGRAIGHGTMLDFRMFAATVGNLAGGVILNLGSAVIMPEVFLKALAIARNKGVDLGNLTAANFDMFSLYRPRINIVERPRHLGAKTYSFLGHHEILLPVFIASVMAKTQA
jgi:hypothetical protein